MDRENLYLRMLKKLVIFETLNRLSSMNFSETREALLLDIV